MEISPLIDAVPAAPATQRTADVLVDILAAAGVDVVFGLPGGTIAPLYDALLDRPSIRVVTTRHESGAMFAAAAYARATGKPAVVLVTSGPGAINAMTGLASAHCDGLPVVLLVGEVPRASFGHQALQEGTAHHLDIVGMADHITKLAVAVTQPNAAPATLRRAIATAMSGRRGPVLLTLPIDVTREQITAPFLSHQVRTDSFVDPDSLDRVAAALQSSRRPVIFAGSGSRWGSGPEWLHALATRLQCPVMTTPKAKGVFPESHPLSLGVFGHGGHPSAVHYLEGGIDLLLAVGTGLSDPATDGWSRLLAPKQHFIQIDAELLQIGRNYPVTMGLVGSADRVLEQVVGRLPRAPVPTRHFGVRRHVDPATLGDGPEGLIMPQRALWELMQTMPAHTQFASDIGEHLMFATHYLEIDDPQGFLVMSGLASMGTSIAGALGMKLAAPHKPVVAVCGDGCFSMGLGDVHTAVQERIPLLVAVLNDQRYGMVELGNQAVYGRTPAYGSDNMSIVDLAHGVGAHAMTIRHTGDILAASLPKLLEAGPLVLDIQIDRSARMPKSGRFADLKTSGPQLLN